jgi:hypothetical protein
MEDLNEEVQKKLIELASLVNKMPLSNKHQVDFIKFMGKKFFIKEGETDEKKEVKFTDPIDIPKSEAEYKVNEELQTTPPNSEDDEPKPQPVDVPCWRGVLEMPELARSLSKQC